MSNRIPVSRVATAAAALALLSAASWAGTTYKFTVGCQSQQLVAQWNTGDIDPGREFLRVSTGTKYSGCTVSDFNAARDGRLPVEVFSGPTGVVQGIPLLGPILGKVFGF
jgi:hypothetical protein